MASWARGVRWGVLTGAPHLNCAVAAVGESLGRVKVRRDHVAGASLLENLEPQAPPVGVSQRSPTSHTQLCG